jgi:hypothetical protein
MPFQLSPGVNVTEIDLTTVVPAVATSTGAIAGIFNWGPIGERVLIDNETKLLNIFGKPNANNAETWFTAANFLSYTNTLYVVRSANTTSADANVGATCAVGNLGGVGSILTEVIKSQAHFDPKYIAANNYNAFDANTRWVAKYPGTLGNSLYVSVCDSPTQYESNLLANGAAVNSTYANAEMTLSISIGTNVAQISVKSTQGNVAANIAASNAYLAYALGTITVGDYQITTNIKHKQLVETLGNIVC